jgi:predicted adenine nucleotide alpha hydrolase (AANH) superfamily ATPase
MDSLRYAMNISTDNELGIEYVKEIRIGYNYSPNLQKWKELISPSELRNNEIWKESNILEFHFIRGDYKEVKSITFKVKSLKKAAQYLLKNDFYGCLQDNNIELDNAQTFGLSIYLTEED